ncbi:MAG: non-ribosomal peptide synthetase, partial [Candidatus Aminicenantes bacterium]
NIEFLGRIDQQVKIRGFRIELGEIENQLMAQEGIKAAVVVDRLDESGQKYLCGYFAAKQAIDPSDLKAELLKHLPDYMVPGYLLLMETIPLTPSGKVNRNALPSPGIQRSGAYVGPRNSIEKKLAAIWSEVLGRDASHASPSPIGIDDNFFDLGGHSLKATILTAKIYKELNIKVPLAEVFKHPTIKGLSFFINASAETRYQSIEPAEQKEYYPLSSAQARFYILQQVTPESTAYNMSAVHQVKGYVEKKKFENALKKLIKRHEMLRTSFQLVDGQPVQQVHDEVKFEMEFYDLATEVTENTEGTRGLAPLPEEPAAVLISSFTRPFDLSRAPLLRLGLIKISPDHHILMFDMHHIITDGTSITIFLKEFMKHYAEPDADDLPRLSLQYKDFSQWQYERLTSGKIKEQEAYWWKQFPGELPALNMPLDFPRPPVQVFEGHRFHFTLEKSLTRHLHHLIKETGTTLFMLLLAVYNILLARYTNQEDIVIGTTIAGRAHPDLENIIGLLIETLALRNYPSGKLEF